jgi:hypothetical protein
MIGEYTMATSEQRLGEHVLAETSMHITLDLLLETVFSLWSMLRYYEQDSLKNSGHLSVERSSVLAAFKKRVICKEYAAVTRT